MRAPPPLPLIHKTRPHSASWAAPLGLPAGLPCGRGDGWVGAWWPTVSLVLPSALGVPSPQCLLEVPSSHTPSPASISDLLGSKHLPGPSAGTVLSCPPPLLSPLPAWPGGRSSHLSAHSGVVCPHSEEGLPADAVGPLFPRRCPDLLQTSPWAPPCTPGGGRLSLPGLRWLPGGRAYRQGHPCNFLPLH